MKNKIVYMPGVKTPIKPSPGFEKKELCTHKLDILGLCGFGCTYCSSIWGNYLRFRRDEFAIHTEQLLGKRLLPQNDPSLTFVWPDVITELRRQLESNPSDWGIGETLVFSMLTDGFSPLLVENGTTKEALQLVLDRTEFRIRILTKNAIVGEPEWIDFFSTYPSRFVVGLSIGNLDDSWARRVEVGTSVPSERFNALSDLQEAGIPTFGMLCPVFPHVLENDALEAMIDAINPHAVEDIWAEPYNDRINWSSVRSSYPTDSFWYEWFTAVYELKQKDLWSDYATDLYLRLRDKGENEGWLHKLKYLLYEDLITQADAARFGGLEGILLQGKPRENGKSKNISLAVYK